VSGRVDEVQLVGLAVARLVEDADSLGLDRDPPLALELHRVEDCARIDRGSTVRVISRMRSASVDLPWSMCAMIEKLRIRSWSMPALQRRAQDDRAQASATPSRPSAFTP
jgi:hypothetical protein